MRGYAIAAAGAALLGVTMILRNSKQGAKQNVTAPGQTATSKNGLPKGIRNNNPLNIEFNPSNKWDGQTGNDGRFAVFSEPFYGIRAAARNLKTYRDKYGIKTVREIIGKWAPAKENDVESYVSSVTKRSGLFADMYLIESDYAQLIAAMIYHENGQQPYSQALIGEATAAGFA